MKMTGRRTSPRGIALSQPLSEVLFTSGAYRRDDSLKTKTSASWIKFEAMVPSRGGGGAGGGVGGGLIRLGRVDDRRRRSSAVRLAVAARGAIVFGRPSGRGLSRTEIRALATVSFALGGEAACSSKPIDTAILSTGRRPAVV